MTVSVREALFVMTKGMGLASRSDATIFQGSLPKSLLSTPLGCITVCALLPFCHCEEPRRGDVAILYFLQWEEDNKITPGIFPITLHG